VLSPIQQQTFQPTQRLRHVVVSIPEKLPFSYTSERQIIVHPLALSWQSKQFSFLSQIRSRHYIALHSTFSEQKSNHLKLAPKCNKSSHMDHLDHKFLRRSSNSGKSQLCIFVTIGFLALKRFFSTSSSLAKEATFKINWEGLKEIAELFQIDLSNESDFKKASFECFRTVFEACLNEKWNLINRADRRVLSQLRDPWGQTLLIAAVNEGDETVVKKLIERNIAVTQTDFNGNTPLHIAANNGFDHLIPWLRYNYLYILNHQGASPFHVAIKKGHLSFMQGLVDSGTREEVLNEGGMILTPVALCVKYNQKKCLDYLLTLPTHSVRDCSTQVGTVLHVAIHHGQFPMLENLLSYPESTDLLKIQDLEGRTPFSLACFLGDLKSMEIFGRLDDLNSTDFNGLTLTHWAVKGKKIESLEFLAYLRARLDRTDRKGRRPMDLLHEDSFHEHEAIKIKTALESLIRLQEYENVTPINPKNRPLPEGIVFKGGGPRVLAYLGALRALKEKGALERVHRTAGTSAGATTAAIFALDPRLSKIDSLENLDLMQFLDPVPGKEHLLQAVLKGKDAQSTLSKILIGGLEIAKVAWNPFSLYRAFSQLDGLCQGEEFRKWIEDQIRERTGIEYCTFGELKNQIQRNKEYLHLHIYATRLEALPGDQILHFSSEDTKYEYIVISDAIRASISIPGVFKPYVVREKTRPGTLEPRNDLGPCVDGGLLKNFPIDAFDQGLEKIYSSFNRRTLGLYLVVPEILSIFPNALLDFSGFRVALPLFLEFVMLPLPSFSKKGLKCLKLACLQAGVTVLGDESEKF
jgi:predicted acylesterase/phospholipase RssA/ankyrin repeat protein